MYNRYIRNDRGNYTQIPEPDDAGRQASPTQRPRQNASLGPDGTPEQTDPHAKPNCPPPPPQSCGTGGEGFSRSLRQLLDRFHLENIDTGDLLLLLLLFLLFKEDADEELLFALGLLLIL